MNFFRRSLLLLLALSLLSMPAFAGGQLTRFDFTGGVEGPIPNSLEARTVPIQWDTRCLPVGYALNTAVLPITQPALDFAEIREVFDRAFDAWNDIPTSFIEMGITGEIQRPRTSPFDVVQFDMVNEVNFLLGASDGGVAFSPSISLTITGDLLPGTDIDQDGDSDVFDPAVTGIETCTDIDGDGDNDLPAGFYEAGTIIDNDVSFNNALVVWTTGPPDSIFGNIDLEGVAVHEFGHSHGLSHSAISQLSPTDGTTPTMIPGVSSGDPLGMLELRTPSSDDVAWSSFVYPEGSCSSGLGALGPGDVAFDSVYGVVTGEVTHGRTGLPLAGGSVFAVDRDTGATVASHYTGTSRYLIDFDTGFFGLFPELADYHLIDGSFSLPLPAGDYTIGIEALDGAPVSSGAISSTTQAGGFFGLQDFNEELFPQNNGNLKPRKVKVKAGRVVSGVDHTTSVDTNLDNFDTVGLNASFDLDGIFSPFPAGGLLAVAWPIEELIAELDAGRLPKGAALRTYMVEASLVAAYGDVALVPGSLDENGAVLDLDDPFVEEEDFIGQDNDYATFYFEKPRQVAGQLRTAAIQGVTHVFVVLEINDTFLGNFPPFVGFDDDRADLFGRSFVSTNGGATFDPWPLNFMYRLIFGELGAN